jgi:IS1 family transposase
MRATARLCEVHLDTVTKLLVDAGEACMAYHDEHVRGVRSKRIQVDELWAFTYCKEKNVQHAKKPPHGAGDTWTWLALDADHKVMVSWVVGPRDQSSAWELMQDLSERLAGRVQLTTDGLSTYLEAVEGVFGADVDFAQLVKIYGPAQGDEHERRYSPGTCRGARKNPISGNPDRAHIATSYIERQNLNIRMQNRRFTRLTNAFSKKVANHAYQVALYTVFYNWCRIHKTLKMTPAMAAGLTDTLRDVDWIAGLVEARDPQPGPRGPYRPRTRRRRDAKAA